MAKVTSLAIILPPPGAILLQSRRSMNRKEHPIHDRMKENYFTEFVEANGVHGRPNPKLARPSKGHQR